MGFKMPEKLWYGRHPCRWILFPLSMVYQAGVTLRRVFLQRFWQRQFSVPIIVVGNLTVGGVGKTPLVIALAQALQARGLRVGIVSRGYGARLRTFPHEVNLEDTAISVGDEPLLLAKKTGCPVIIAPKRVQAVDYLLRHHQSQVVISDDGLQHYAMGRAIEIVVMDGSRGLGNGLCLPAGPLREPPHRLNKTDFILINQGSPEKIPCLKQDASLLFSMHCIPGQMISLKQGQEKKLTELTNPVAAVAAIGNPKRFFATLDALGVSFNKYPFPDHYQFKPEDLSCYSEDIVMTEKDAVKCIPFATDNMYFLPIEAKMDNKFWDKFWSHKQLQGLSCNEA